MAIRYLGSKARIAHSIADLIGAPQPASTFIDAFVGTGAVAAAAADRGWAVSINDSLRSATLIAGARLLAHEDVAFESFGGYAQAQHELMTSPLQPGFMTAHYSPESLPLVGHERMYFTAENASKLDTWRTVVSGWRAMSRVSADEHDLLLADILEAANTVANTAGTYGSYLKSWGPSAMNPVRLEPRNLRAASIRRAVRVGRAEDLLPASSDVVYLDPPYTKRQYAAYYHILETLAWGDEPEITGSTGLRPWKHLASSFSYRSRALESIVSLVQSYAAHRVLLSYSDQGHASLEALIKGLGLEHTVTVHDLGSVGRYTPNVAAVRAGSAVQEYVIECVRTSALIPAEPSGAHR